MRFSICRGGSWREGNFIKKLLWRVSIARLLIGGAFFLIFIPFSITVVYFTHQIVKYNHTEQNVAETDDVNLIVLEIENRIQRIEETGWDIRYNSTLVSFLANDYASNVPKGYEQYLNFVHFLENYNTLERLDNSVNQRLFMVNDTIPEGFGCFHRISRIENKQWYKEFLAGEANYQWIFADTRDYYDHWQSKETQPDERFIFLNKIFSYNGKYIGIFAIEVKVDYLLQPYDMKNLYILQEQTQTLLHKPDAEILEHAGGVQNFIEALEKTGKEKIVNVMRKIEPLGLQVGTVSQPQSMNDLILLFESGAVAMLVGCLLLYTIFGILLYSSIDILRKGINNIQTSIFENKLIDEPDQLNNEIGQIVHQFNIQCRKIQQMISNQIKLETAEKEIQIRHMQSIISPHFFYNTLDVISASMILAGQEQIAEAVANFAKMMRYAFKADKIVTLGSELSCIESFVKLQKVCYNDQLEMRTEVDDCLKLIYCPKFILQPVVENSIRHGMRPDNKKLHICVRARIVDGEILEVSVEDDGTGMAPERLEELRHFIEDSSEVEDANLGIGLGAVNTQLKIHNRSQFTLKVMSKEDVGTVVILPIRINGGD